MDALKQQTNDTLKDIISDERLPASQRREPFCGVFEKCGGCTLQHVNYDYQLELKKKHAEEAFSSEIQFDVIPCPAPVGGRHRAAMACRMQNEKPVTGLFRSRTHKVVSVHKCPMHAGKINELIHSAHILSVKHGLIFFREKRNKGKLKYLTVRLGSDNNASLLVTTSGRSTPGLKGMAKELHSSFNWLNGVAQTIVSEGNAIVGKDIFRVTGTPSVNCNVIDRVAKVSAGSFFQVYPESADKLFREVQKWSEKIKPHNLIDLYSGTGAMSLAAGEYAEYVIAMEIPGPSAEDGRENLTKAFGNKATMIARDATDAFASFIRSERYSMDKDAVIVDPPRKGLGEKLCTLLEKRGPKHIIYVSCNPLSLARDLNFLTSRTYRTTSLKGVDLFPQTMHLECIAQLERK